MFTYLAVMTSFMARDLRSKVLTWWISGDSTQITIFLSTDSIITIFNVTYSVLYTSMLTYFYHNDPYFDVMGLVKPCEKSVPQFFQFFLGYIFAWRTPQARCCILARFYFSVPFDSDQSPIRHDMVKRKLQVQVNTAEPTQHKPAPTSCIVTLAASSLKAKV